MPDLKIHLARRRVFIIAKEAKQFSANFFLGGGICNKF